jgi:hypothetical protein
MLPELSRALKSDFPADPAAEISQSGAESASSSDGAEGATDVDHHCQICPTCGQRLTGHRCKLVCRYCGYYMSCADYY